MSHQISLYGIVGSALLLASYTVVQACGGYGEQELHPITTLIADLGVDLRDSQSNRTDQLIQSLRYHELAAVDAAIDYRKRRASELGGRQEVEIERIDAAIDKIAGQRFATQSKLYWHKSLGRAMHRAKQSGKPILSLRMLGRLDEEFSCANSRFFRCILYPDPQIAADLRENFVLHWQSVREVPLVTVDFGDGRQLRQPLTGNSVHLILDTDGRPFDALPGLVSPQEFLSWLHETCHFWNSNHGLTDDQFWGQVAKFHRSRAERRRSESSLAISHSQSVRDLNPLDQRWGQLASTASLQLSPPSRGLVDRQRPNAERAMVTTVMKAVIETPMLRLVQPIESMIARDTVFNLYALQTKIDDWFADVQVPTDHQTMTNRIYSEVFLMPLDDPWLGLSPSDQYTALDDGGRLELDRTL